MIRQCTKCLVYSKNLIGGQFNLRIYCTDTEPQQKSDDKHKNKLSQKKQNILITGDPVRVLCREGNIKESKQPVRRSQFCCLDVRRECNKNEATVLRARTCSQSHFRNRCRCYENY